MSLKDLPWAIGWWLMSISKDGGWISKVPDVVSRVVSFVSRYKTGILAVVIVVAVAMAAAGVSWWLVVNTSGDDWLRAILLLLLGESYFGVYFSG